MFSLQAAAEQTRRSRQQAAEASTKQLDCIVRWPLPEQSLALSPVVSRSPSFLPRSFSQTAQVLRAGREGYSTSVIQRESASGIILLGVGRRASPFIFYFILFHSVKPHSKCLLKLGLLKFLKAFLCFILQQPVVNSRV